MNTNVCQDPVKVPVKRRGGKNLWTPAIEEEIAREYYDNDVSAIDLVPKYAPLSKTKTCSASVIRLAAGRGQARRIGRGEPAALGITEARPA